MGQRRQTKFYETATYSKELDEFPRRDKKLYGRILDRMQKFEREYQNSTSDSDISPGFDVKQIDNQAGSYQLKQVQLMHDFRAAVLVPDRRSDAWWIDLWKKTRLRNEKEINTAKGRARQAWNNEIKSSR